jgi:hypothetical protein
MSRGRTRLLAVGALKMFFLLSLSVLEAVALWTVAVKGLVGRGGPLAIVAALLLGSHDEWESSFVMIVLICLWKLDDFNMFRTQICWMKGVSLVVLMFKLVFALKQMFEKVILC